MDEKALSSTGGPEEEIKERNSDVSKYKAMLLYIVLCLGIGLRHYLELGRLKLIRKA